MYMGKVFRGLKFFSLYSIGNIFCFYIFIVISFFISIGIFEGEGKDRNEVGLFWFGNFFIFGLV